MANRYKLVFILLLFYCFTFHLKAQNKDLYNVKLKSGLIIKCGLISFLPDSTVTIRQYDMVSTVHCRDIVSIEHSGYNSTYNNSVTDTLRNTTIKKPIKQKVVFKKLPENIWTAGVQLCLNLNGGGPYGEAVFGSGIKLSTLCGMNKHFEGGFSLGLDVYDPEWVVGVIAGQVRYYLVSDKYKSPILYSQLGYGFNLSNSPSIQTGGINLATGVGLSSRTKTQGIFTVMLGFRLQTLTDVPGNYGIGSETYNLMGVEAKVEWRF